jgi:hypothetical protein
MNTCPVNHILVAGTGTRRYRSYGPFVHSSTSLGERVWMDEGSSLLVVASWGRRPTAPAHRPLAAPIVVAATGGGREPITVGGRGAVATEVESRLRLCVGPSKQVQSVQSSMRVADRVRLLSSAVMVILGDDHRGARSPCRGASGGGSWRALYCTWRLSPLPVSSFSPAGRAVGGIWL